MSTPYIDLLCRYSSMLLRFGCVPMGRKYLAQTDKFCKRAGKYGYTNKRITTSDMIRNRDTRQLHVCDKIFTITTTA